MNVKYRTYKNRVKKEKREKHSFLNLKTFTTFIINHKTRIHFLSKGAFTACLFGAILFVCRTHHTIDSFCRPSKYAKRRAEFCIAVDGAAIF